MGVQNKWPAGAGDFTLANTGIEGVEDGKAASLFNNAVRAYLAELRNFAQQLVGGKTTAGTSNAYTLTTGESWSSYPSAHALTIRLNHTNTGAATLNVDALGTKAIVDEDGAALVAGALVSGRVVSLVYDGTSYQLIGRARPLSNVGALAGVASLNNTSPHEAGRNLLVNSDFAINQRAFAGGALAATVFGHDRWVGGSGGTSYTVSGVVVTQASGVLDQRLEAPGLASTTVTVSLYDPSATVTVTLAAYSSGSGSVSGNITTGSGQRSVTLEVPAGVTGHVLLSLSVATSTTWSKVKLERGATATPYVAPDPTHELARCKRYYQRLSREITGAFQTANDFGYFAEFPEMRAAPTITKLSTTPELYVPGIAFVTSSGDTGAPAFQTATSVSGTINGFTGRTVGQGAQVLNPEPYLALSAEI